MCFFLSGLDSHNPSPQLFPRGFADINEQNLAIPWVCKSLLHKIDIVFVLLGTCWWLTLVKSRTLSGGKWGQEESWHLLARKLPQQGHYGVSKEGWTSPVRPGGGDVAIGNRG